MQRQRDEADERWRDVLFEMVKRAKHDAEFRARVEATGAVLDNFEAVLERVKRDPERPEFQTVACREFWWGFQLEIPHDVVAGWTVSNVERDLMLAAIGQTPGPVSPFRKRAAGYLANHVAELQAQDRGAGVTVSMTWMAPNVFVATAPAPKK